MQAAQNLGYRPRLIVCISTGNAVIWYRAYIGNSIFYNGLRLYWAKHGVLGVECSNHSVPTIFFNDLAAFERLCCFCHSDFPSDPGVFHHASLRFRIVNAGVRESVADTLFAAAIS